MESQLKFAKDPSKTMETLTVKDMAYILDCSEDEVILRMTDWYSSENGYAYRVCTYNEEDMVFHGYTFKRED
jgi:hypothetical protein